MRSKTTLPALLTCVVLLFPAAAHAGDGDDGGLLAGKVRTAAEPLEAVKVYAYQLADLGVSKVDTDEDGNFFFRELPAGLYKIVAYKAGFLPAVVMLARSSAAADQFVDLELAERKPSEDGIDFWRARASIPKDILREIELAEAPRPAPPAAQATQQLAEAVSTVRAEMQAMAGLDQVGDGAEAQVSGGRVGLDARVGETRLGLEGSYLERQSAAAGGQPLDGRQSNLSFELQSPNDGRLMVASRQNEMTATTQGVASPVDFENYLVSWSQPVGNAGRSELRAQYTNETNFYSLGWLDHASIPEASRTLRLMGTYSMAIGQTGSFETELRYRERQSDYSGTGDYSGTDRLQRLSTYAEESVELIGRGGWKIQPAVLVEYGLYTKLRDGRLTLTPHGGVVWRMGDSWEGTTEVSHRLHQEEDPLFGDFIPSFLDEGGACEPSGEACYRIAFTHRNEDDERLTLGARHREVGETLRLYFDEDFFNQMESLYLVEGDRLPEVQFALSRRLSPTVLTTLESNIGYGGGGLFQTLDSDSPFENRVQYLVTSLDTHFQETSTGLFVAFHRLQQELTSVGPEAAVAGPSLEVDRLQVNVTQDLTFLAGLAADWAVHLNMEVSRGTSPFTAEEESEDQLRKRFLGGLAVRF